MSDFRQLDQILTALQAAPLDRIRLMKTVFLVWHRSGRPQTGPFHFQPYLYGPCAFDLYTALEDMEHRGLIAQTPHPISRWASYYLTGAGKAEASRLTLECAQHVIIADIARWAATQTFRSLLNQVYQEAPDYASNSILREGG